MIRGKLVTEENIGRVKDLYINKGRTYVQIANEMGISITTVRRMVMKLQDRGENTNIRPKKGHSPITGNPKLIDEIRTMRDRGETIRNVAAKLGVNRSTVLKITREHGIKKHRNVPDEKKEDFPKYTGLDHGESLEEAMERVNEKPSVGSLYKMGMSPEAIASKLGMSINAVFGVLDNMPLALLPAQEAQDVKVSVANPLGEIKPAETEDHKEDAKEVKEVKEVKKSEVAGAVDEESPRDVLRKALGMILVAHGKMLIELGQSGHVDMDSVKSLDGLIDVEDKVLEILESA